MSDSREYLLSYGATGEFGRFRSLSPLSLERGARAVVRSHRGLEIAECLCPVRPGHARFLPNTTVGAILRAVTAEDEAAAARMQNRGEELFHAARQVAAEKGLPVEVLDAEVLLDGEQAILHHLPWGPFDERELVSTLSTRFDLRVLLHSLRAVEEEAAHGCGREDCGNGGCSSCGSGGCGTCGVNTEEVQAHFAALREQMDAREAQRVSLL